MIVVPVISPSIAFEHDAVAARAEDLAIADRDAAAVRELDQAASSRAAALPLPSKMMPESRMWSAPRATMIGALSVATMRVAPGTPIEPRAGRQHEAARAIDAGREDQRQARAGGAVDRALQRFGLVVRCR